MTPTAGERRTAGGKPHAGGSVDGVDGGVGIGVGLSGLHARSMSSESHVPTRLDAFRISWRNLKAHIMYLLV